MTKSLLRKICLAERRSLGSEQKEFLSRQIAELFFETFDLSKIKFLHCFLPIEKFNEINTRPIFERVWRDFPSVQTLVPRVDFQTGEMENLIFSPETEMAKSRWEIFEPTHDEKIETKKIDAVLVPLLCFDTKGFRVGYGKGFYDKFLKNTRPDCLHIGLNYFAPVEEISDVNEYDIPLKYCITPDKMWKF